MSDFPQTGQLPLFVHTWTRWSMGGEIMLQGGTPQPSSATWPTASTAYYMPFWLPWPYPVNRVFWLNGSSVTSVNVDVGIYTADGTQIYHTGSVARSGTTASQYVTPSPTFVLTPGRYYFGYSCDSVTANRGGYANASVTATRLRLYGMLQQASVLPLPATMTGVAVTSAFFPLCGITRTTTGF